MGNCVGSSSQVNSTSHPTSASRVEKVPCTNTTSHSSNLTSRSSTVESKTYRLPTPRSDDDQNSSSPGLKAFSFDELKTATNNFRRDSLIGEGFSCYVYKGWIDKQTLSPSKPGSGIVVAVKKHTAGFRGHKEWLTILNYLGQVHHANISRHIGYCLDGENLFLVNELTPNRSLENHLFGRGPQPLSWETRIKVAIGAARGLSFIHDAEPQIIYRDFKASNVLLDAEFNAKLSNFSLAKAGPTDDQTDHVSTEVVGTYGYAAPEYVATGHLCAKSDVYSYGVVLLELFAGRRAIDRSRVVAEHNLVDWAKPYLGNQRKVHGIIDPKLEGRYPKMVAFTVATLALQCLNPEPRSRPTMSEVVQVLEGLQDLEPSGQTSHANHKSPSNRYSISSIFPCL